MNNVPIIQVQQQKQTVQEEIRSLNALLYAARQKVKEEREAVNDIMLSDNEYRGVQTQLESLQDRKKELIQILKDSKPEIKDHKETIKNTNKIIKDYKQQLSDRLETYQKDTQMTIFDGMSIVKNYSLK